APLRLFSLGLSLMPRRPPSPTLFPYTTLFRSRPGILGHQIPGFGLPQHSRVELLGKGSLHTDEMLSLKAQLRAALHHLRQRQDRSEEHTSELQSRFDLVCRLLLEKKK